MSVRPKLDMHKALDAIQRHAADYVRCEWRGDRSGNEAEQEAYDREAELHSRAIYRIRALILNA